MIDLREVGIPQCSGKLTWFYICTQSPLQESMWYRCTALWDACVLVKIMRGHGSFADRKDLHARGFYRDHVVDILEPSFDQQESPPDHGETVLTKQVGRDDRIGDAAFVFEAEENKSFRSAGTL